MSVMAMPRVCVARLDSVREMAARGLTTTQIAREMMLAASTARKYRQRAGCVAPMHRYGPRKAPVGHPDALGASMATSVSTASAIAAESATRPLCGPVRVGDSPGVSW